jgi:hypothetical protein
MKISLFIPTIPEHIKYLHDILSIYINESTVKPDEIIVSVSNYKVIPINLLNPIIENYQNVKFILHDKVMLAGPNRQVSKDFCDGDIIIYHDSDDLPHIQRIEIIKYFFETKDIVHLNHSYEPTSNQAIKNGEYHTKSIDISKIKWVDTNTIKSSFFPNNILKECLDFTKAYTHTYHTHAGVVAIKKEVLNHVRWKDRHELSFSPKWYDLNYKGAEDYEFCMEVLYHFNKSIIIDSKIYFHYCF